jgi:hypothetical protein
MFSRWAYILVGRNGTGKTMFQRNLLYYLCNERYRRLPRNVVNEIRHLRAPKDLKNIFTANRSYQEQHFPHKSVGRYFQQFFREADVCILASHPSVQDVSEMIQELRLRCYNIAGVFWSNAYGGPARRVSLLPWNETLWMSNPHRQSNEEVEEQLDRLACHFSQLIVARAQIW